MSPKPAKERRRKNGRPTKFNAAIATEVLKVLRAGLLVKDAAALSGIHRDTLNEWIRRGRDGRASTELREFSAAVGQARATAKLRAVGSVHTAMSKDWKAAAWWLGVTDPKNYGPKVRQTLNQEFGDAITRIRTRVSAEVFEQVLAAIIEDGSDEGVGEDPRGETVRLQ